MKYQVTQADDHIVIDIHETRIDAAIAVLFKDTLRPIMTEASGPVHLRLEQVMFMDSSGLGAVIALRKALRDDLVMVLDQVTPNVERVFRLTRMDSVFTIHPVGGAAVA
ncbi:STAS domain-containing protein [Paracoccus sp. (in: a-proteobacteria)]|uniref:STAS domain-containing protein n=1 Tax=Paracoccus sp. TaxID=267 RepID=UPI0026DF8649|nr:STAS domain-containing protein [Paracoccus sp. (in: a-proteobacteria)]MDO5647454.1 STAS domain-containing protein [Paracoccus sp. (in: a-proteobacteria)]